LRYSQTFEWRTILISMAMAISATKACLKGAQISIVRLVAECLKAGIMKRFSTGQDLILTKPSLSSDLNPGMASLNRIPLPAFTVLNQTLAVPLVIRETAFPIQFGYHRKHQRPTSGYRIRLQMQHIQISPKKLVAVLGWLSPQRLHCMCHPMISDPHRQFPLRLSHFNNCATNKWSLQFIYPRMGLNYC
jgi:hypothetical protein